MTEIKLTSKTDTYLQTALNGIINSIKELSEEKRIEQYILDAIIEAFPSNYIRKNVIEVMCEYLKENNK